ncbi:MAG: hypothetical protein HY000_05075 [Planctomycetes bacterium]|nr:hypothetical protein [Planctomycetota bacterium]
MFSAAAAVSWIRLGGMSKQQAADQETEATGQEAAEPDHAASGGGKGAGHGRKHARGSQKGSASAGQESTSARAARAKASPPPAAESDTAAGGAGVRRVAVRPDYVAGAEQAVQLAANLKEREAKLQERDALFATREAHLQLVYDDLRAERAAIDELRKQLENEVKVLEEKVTHFEQQRSDLDNRQQAAEQARTRLETEEEANVKMMAGWLNSMDEESVAKIIGQMANTGMMSTAIKVLGKMTERKAAKALPLLPDGLAAQLMEKVEKLKLPPKKGSTSAE